MYAYSHLGINWLTCRIGKLLCMEESTEKLEQLRYAKCLAEVIPGKDLPDSFAVRLVDGEHKQLT